MHFQYPPHAEMKLVSCLRGEVLDVAVDLRPGSPTFLQLACRAAVSADNRRALLIPEGFAHGFQALTDDVRTALLPLARPMRPRPKAGSTRCDPRLAIAWPLPVTELSARDAGHPADRPII